MRMIRVRDYQQMSSVAADMIFAQVVLKPDSVLGLATGGTPVGTYKRLIQKYQEGALDLSEVRTVNLDEYVGLGANDENSYRYFMQKNFFDGINIDPANIYIPDGRAKDMAAECERYDNVLQNIGGIDLQLLGVGVNGHIGFNEPADAFTKKTHCVALAESTIDANQRFFAKKEDVPARAVTVGILDIVQAGKILMIASGREKAKAIAEAFFGPMTPRMPASILQLHKDVTLVADEDALSLVK